MLNMGENQKTNYFEPIVSVVVPIYNAEKYLNKCLSSLSCLNSCFQIILIDDGSTDNSAEICKEFCSQYNNFRYIRKENGGPSSARNLGIQESTTCWISFVDADDWVQPEVYNKICTKLNNNSELVCIRFQSEKENKRKLYERNNDYEINAIDVRNLRKGLIYSDYKYIRNLIKKGYLFHGPVAKFYRLKILKNYEVSFPEEVSYGEDICFNIDYLEHVKTGIMVNAIGYYYRQVEASITHNFCKGKSQEILNFVIILEQKIMDEKDLTLFYKTGVRQYLFALKLEFCNRNNQESYAIRRKKALEYLDKEPFVSCCKKADYRDMSVALGGMYFLVKRRLFAVLNLLIKQKFK